MSKSKNPNKWVEKIMTPWQYMQGLGWVYKNSDQLQHHNKLHVDEDLKVTLGYRRKRRLPQRSHQKWSNRQWTWWCQSIRWLSYNDEWEFCFQCSFGTITTDGYWQRQSWCLRPFTIVKMQSKKSGKITFLPSRFVNRFSQTYLRLLDVKPRWSVLFITSNQAV